jgi:hypothetical protein
MGAKLHGGYLKVSVSVVDTTISLYVLLYVHIDIGYISSYKLNLAKL